MAARESGYCTSFILMSARWDFQGVSQFPRFVSLLGFGLEDCGLSKRPQGLLGHFLGFLLPHLAMHEAGDKGGHHKDS